MRSRAKFPLEGGRQGLIKIIDIEVDLTIKPLDYLEARANLWTRPAVLSRLPAGAKRIRTLGPTEA